VLQTVSSFTGALLPYRYVPQAIDREEAEEAAGAARPAHSSSVPVAAIAVPVIVAGEQAA
jgi:hypothetical protein